MNRTLRFGAPLAAAVLFFGLVPAGADVPTTIHACRNGDHGVRLVDDPADCHTGEAVVDWNVTGPAGPAGPTGAQGPAGADGLQGPQGPAGFSRLTYVTVEADGPTVQSNATSGYAESVATATCPDGGFAFDGVQPSFAVFRVISGSDGHFNEARTAWVVRYWSQYNSNWDNPPFAAHATAHCLVPSN